MTLTEEEMRARLRSKVDSRGTHEQAAIYYGIKSRQLLESYMSGRNRIPAKLAKRLGFERIDKRETFYVALRS